MKPNVTITRPVHTPEEREFPMQQIEKAAAALIVAMRQQEQERRANR